MNCLYGCFKILVIIYDECLSIVDVRVMFFELGGYKKLIKGKVDSVLVCLIFISWFESFWD